MARSVDTTMILSPLTVGMRTTNNNMLTNLILGVAPLDLSATGTEMAGYVATAAGAGVALLAALYGVRVIIRAFKGVK